MSKIPTITTGRNKQSLLQLQVKAIAENTAEKKFCGKPDLTLNITVYVELRRD